MYVRTTFVRLRKTRYNVRTSKRVVSTYTLGKDFLQFCEQRCQSSQLCVIKCGVTSYSVKRTFSSSILQVHIVFSCCFHAAGMLLAYVFGTQMLALIILNQAPLDVIIKTMHIRHIHTSLENTSE